MMEPHDERKESDCGNRPDHRDIAEDPLFRKDRNDFRKNPECRENQDVDFRMAPSPDQIDVHHRVAAVIGRKEMGVEKAV